MAVIRKGQETPLHPPFGSGRGDKGRRQANQKPHVEYWHELLAYIDSAYAKKLGRHYPWNNLVRKNLWNMARVHSAWGVMALWDLHLEGESWWSQRTGRSVYGMIRDAGRLMGDPRFKQLAAKHEENLARQRFGGFAKAIDVLSRFTGTNVEVMLSNPISSPIRLNMEFPDHPNQREPALGRCSAAQINFVTKSGTNIFHGSAFEPTTIASSPPTVSSTIAGLRRYSHSPS